MAREMVVSQLQFSIFKKDDSCGMSTTGLKFWFGKGPTLFWQLILKIISSCIRACSILKMF